MDIQVNYPTARTMIIRALTKTKAPMIWGSPGMGKSDMVRSIAQEYNLCVIDLRLAQSDPTDLLGFPHIDGQAGRASYLPMSTFPIAGDPLPTRVIDGEEVAYDGWILFLDEFPQAPESVQNAAFKLVLDRQVGEFDLHPNCAIIAAGNHTTDRAGARRLNTAISSRFSPHIKLETALEPFIEYARGVLCDTRIISYLQYQPQKLHAFDPDSPELTFPSPRTWMDVNAYINGISALDDIDLAIIAGNIGESTAREFFGFTQIYKELITVPEILNNPALAPVPDEPELLFALTGSLVHNATKTNLVKLLDYIERLPAEFRAITIQGIITQDESMLEIDAVDRWIDKNVAELFA